MQTLQTKGKVFHKHLAHPAPVRLHNRPIVLFVTVTLQQRNTILASEWARAALVQAWNDANAWRVGYYMVMPDHVHWFCAPGEMNFPPIRRWVGYWKRLVGKIEPRLHKCFQANCWDTQMRDAQHYIRKQEYVSLNPVRRDLVRTSEEWPFQGTLKSSPWLW